MSEARSEWDIPSAWEPARAAAHEKETVLRARAAVAGWGWIGVPAATEAPTRRELPAPGTRLIA